MKSGAQTSSGDVCQTELLVVALGLIVREVPLQRPLNVARRGFVAFDEVLVVAVHLPDEVGHPLEDVWRVNLPGEPLGRSGSHSRRVPIRFHVTQNRKCSRKSYAGTNPLIKASL